MATYTQASRSVGITTPLGEDVLILESLNGHEELGRLFQFNLSLLSEDGGIAFEDLVGQTVTLRAEHLEGAPRNFNGYISTLTQLGHIRQGSSIVRYHATMVPWLWFLSRTSDCRIFQEKSTPVIIKEVFEDNGFTDIEDRLTGTYPDWEYCVQYRETDLNFVSRLMEEAGIYYFFTHTESTHTLVLCDSMNMHQPNPGFERLPYAPYVETEDLRSYISEWRITCQAKSGVYAHTDYNFKQPRSNLGTLRDNPAAHDRANYEVYDYPGGYPETGPGEQIARVRLEELQAQGEVIEGATDVRGIQPGCVFDLEDHPRTDQNRQVLVTSADYRARTPGYDGPVEDNMFHCQFTAIDQKHVFRPARVTPKPTVQGLQTAVVVGKKGEEIFTDEYGRVKVQFHWDRYGKSDENSSCWIRVSQASAGKLWGSIFIPRIGQEVVVEFLEGDPDRPLITGVVYNAVQQVPYTLPDEMTKSVIKTNSSKGGEGFNEIRFEDKDGEEQIFIHAEKDYDLRIKNERTERIYGNQHTIVGWEKDGEKGGDLREMVYEDRHETIHSNKYQHIGGDMQLLVGGIEGDGNQDIVVKANKQELIEGAEHHHVKGDLSEKVDGAHSVTVGGDLQEKVGMKQAMEAGQEIHLKAGMKVIIEAGMQISLVGPGGFVDIGPAGVTIQGTMVKINSGGSAGSGSGASPTEPEDAEEAAPVEPNIADNSTTGNKSAPD